MNARALGYTTRIDEAILVSVGEHFTAVARNARLPIGKPLEYDVLHPQHQVPGGMISNFRFQLANLGKLDKLPEVLEEVTRVRAEFGYPIMVTPYSQFFGVQAAINVMVGERYREVTDEVLLYALGAWGKEEAESIDANLKDRLLDTARAKELAKLPPAELSLRQFGEKFGGPGVSDDDALLRYFAGAEAVETMKAASGEQIPLNTAAPLLSLIEQTLKRDKTTQVYIQHKNFRLRCQRRSASA
jgi:oxaloacetate decarboxylase alpha subunit